VRRNGSAVLLLTVEPGGIVSESVKPRAAGLSLEDALGQVRSAGHLPSMTDILLGDGAALEATVRSAATGDEAAFARLVADHHASMIRVAYVISGDADTSLDAVQSAWAIAWRRMRSLRDPSQVRAWLVAIAANEARQAVRRRRRERVVDISEDIARAESGHVEDAADVADLDRALRGLKAEDRSLLALRYAAGLDSSEIARQMGMSPSGVRSRLARLLERLRDDLALEPEIDR